MPRVRNSNSTVSSYKPRGVPDVPLNVDHYDEHELTSASVPLPPPGSAKNPVVIEDDEDARRHRALLALGPPPGLENNPRRSDTRQTTNNSQAQSSTNNNRSQPSTNNLAQGSSSSRTNDRDARAGPSSAAEPAADQTRYKKTASHGHAPKTSSPLKQVAFKASTHVLAVPATQDRWHVPPRGYSTSTVSVNSVTSSDSEYDE
ncbi:hypothetical protein VTO73DRAFT_8558 [Trametes versicolor]